MSAANEEFGPERLQAAVKAAAPNAAALAEATLAAVRQHVAGHAQHDDMALLAFARAG